jgi:hypothetical protein
MRPARSWRLTVDDLGTAVAELKQGGAGWDCWPNAQAWSLACKAARTQIAPLSAEGEDRGGLAGTHLDGSDAGIRHARPLRGTHSLGG